MPQTFCVCLTVEETVYKIFNQDGIDRVATLLLTHTVEDPMDARPYLFSDGQIEYNRVVLVCTVNVYIPDSLGRRPILRYQVLQVATTLYSLYLQSED